MNILFACTKKNTKKNKAYYKEESNTKKKNYMDHLLHCIQSVIKLAVVLAGSNVNVCRINLRLCHTKQNANHHPLNPTNPTLWALHFSCNRWNHIWFGYMHWHETHNRKMFGECVTGLIVVVKLRSIKAADMTQNLYNARSIKLGAFTVLSPFVLCVMVISTKLNSTLFIYTYGIVGSLKI